MKIEAILKEVKKEIQLWKNMDSYVKKNLKGKTLTKYVEKEIKEMLKERQSYANQLKGMSNKS